MQELLIEFKREFGIVNEISIYNTCLNKFEFLEGENVKKLIIDLDNGKCLQTTQSIFFSSTKKKMFQLKGDFLLAGLQLTSKAVFNRALFMMKAKELVKRLETT
ncbi:hypothetical protein [Marinoscillum sp.]|uniref:hypothetical protein n=1 Tax=Marinoscillum sp. TaxID=2024838 RepID=UPI003BAC4731